MQERLRSVRGSAILSKGRSPAEIDKLDKGSCRGYSKIFIAIDPKVFASEEEVRNIVAGTKEQLHHTESTHENSPVRYPGEEPVQMRLSSIGSLIIRLPLEFSLSKMTREFYRNMPVFERLGCVLNKL